MKSHGLLWFAASILAVLALPFNPLVILKVIVPNDIEWLRYIGWIFWTIGIILLIASYYYIYLRREKVLIDRGIYSIIRHPMYLAVILGIFVATVFLYQHWVFLAIGIPGVACWYLIARQEDQINIEKFGDDYRLYMQKVPRMNLLAGVLRFLHRRRGV